MLLQQSMDRLTESEFYELEPEEQLEEMQLRMPKELADRQRLGAVFRMIRRHNRMTQALLAERSGVTERTMRNIEAGSVRITLYRFRMLAQAVSEGRAKPSAFKLLCHRPTDAERKAAKKVVPQSPHELTGRPMPKCVTCKRRLPICRTTCIDPELKAEQRRARRMSPPKKDSKT